MAGTRKRGRETALDMLRTLAVIFAVVLPLWYFGQGSPQDRKRIRPVDPKPALSDFVAETHGPAPSSVPARWTCTVRTYDAVAKAVRIGYVVGDHYLEFAGGSGEGFLADATGRGARSGAVQVGDVAWDDYLSAAGQESLVRTVKGVTVVVGGVRETASRPELEQLAALVR